MSLNSGRVLSTIGAPSAGALTSMVSHELLVHAGMSACFELRPSTVVRMTGPVLLRR